MSPGTSGVRICAVTLVALLPVLSACASSRSDVDPVLDGTAPLQPGALATLARQRAALGAAWLARTSRPDGSFAYVYRPDTDTYEVDPYNEVRHAGVTYSMFQAYAASGEEDVRRAAEGAARWIEAQSVPAPDGSGRAFEHRGGTRLGGQALALVALLERRRVLHDNRHDGLIGELARFLLSLERPDAPGRYWEFHSGGSRLPEPSSVYYPGETLLALSRLARHFPEGPYRDAAVRAADYLVHVRDGNLPTVGAVPRDDHWLTMALNDLYRSVPDPDYARVVHLQAQRMIVNQHQPNAGDPDLVGAPTGRRPVSFTSTATKGEALVAAWALATYRGDAEAPRYAEAARRTAQFQMRVQFTPEKAHFFGRSDRLVGAWGQDAARHHVRMDFIQHNVSSLLGVWSMTASGDLGSY